MRRTNTIIIGGGQAGLATSRCLSDRAIDHVVLERGQVAQSWRTERWDSLRLLTPNWQSRLPGYRYQGPDPDGYMTMPEVIDYLERYAGSFNAPVQTGTEVRALERAGRGFRVSTNRGDWLADNVVIATGYCGAPHVPAMADQIPGHIVQLVPTDYRNPDQLPDGGVLVVGASASGLQLTDEIHASGRPVTLAVGRHTRLPRSYRGRDIMWWLDRMGVLDETTDDVFSVEASRRQPSLQLVGRPDHSTLDLGVLQDAGVRLVGRARAVEGGTVLFTDDLEASTTEADAKLARILARIDSYIEDSGMAGSVLQAEPIVPVTPVPATTAIDLDRSGIATVLWATGFRRSYPWLRVPVLDECGEIRHHGGVTPVPGLYVIGLNFLRRRKSTYIDGVGDDARDLAEHIVGRTPGGHRAAA